MNKIVFHGAKEMTPLAVKLTAIADAGHSGQFFGARMVMRLLTEPTMQCPIS
jgi:hypothetical protein